MSRGLKLFEIVTLADRGAESRINFMYTFPSPTLALDSILLASFHTAFYLLTLALLDLTDLLQCCTVILHFDSNLLFLASFISKWIFNVGEQIEHLCRYHHLWERFSVSLLYLSLIYWYTVHIFCFIWHLASAPFQKLLHKCALLICQKLLSWFC